MSHADPNTELESILARRELGELTESDRRRLNELVQDDPEALAELVEQFETEALLRWHHGAVEPPTNTTPPAGRREWDPLVMVAVVGGLAACLLVAVGLVRILWFNGNRDIAQRGHLQDNAVGPSAPAPPGHAPPRGRGPVWRVLAVGSARYVVMSQYRISLASGALSLESAPHRSATIEVETPAGKASAEQGRFQIETQITKEGAVTRVVILEGKVTISNEHGMAAASAGRTLSVSADRAPQIEPKP